MIFRLSISNQILPFVVFFFVICLSNIQWAMSISDAGIRALHHTYIKLSLLCIDVVLRMILC